MPNPNPSTTTSRARIRDEHFLERLLRRKVRLKRKRLNDKRKQKDKEVKELKDGRIIELVRS